MHRTTPSQGDRRWAAHDFSRRLQLQSGGSHHRDLPKRCYSYRGDQNLPRAGSETRPLQASPISSQNWELSWVGLKTGTPPRLKGTTINYSNLEPQWGDANPEYLSSITAGFFLPQTACYITRTTEETHAVVRENIHKTAVYSGAILGSGPRYCPSIEDKITRFSDRASHRIFLEPEGFDDPLVYPNGVSTSLPADLQQAFIRTIPGLENVVIVRPGYAIEYDYVSPTQLHRNLMTRQIEGIFLAGQINGTTGYEEAAAQGIVAGINAARYVGGCADAVFDRADCYTGVMIDDLTTRGVTEPYRMFTSRAEYRLRLRADNADDVLRGWELTWASSGKCAAKTIFASRRDSKMLDCCLNPCGPLPVHSMQLGSQSGTLTAGDPRLSGLRWSTLRLRI